MGPGPARRRVKPRRRLRPQLGHLHRRLQVLLLRLRLMARTMAPPRRRSGSNGSRIRDIKRERVDSLIRCGSWISVTREARRRSEGTLDGLGQVKGSG